MVARRGVIVCRLFDQDTSCDVLDFVFSEDARDLVSMSVMNTHTLNGITVASAADPGKECL